MSLSLITLALTLSNILLNVSSSKIKHNFFTACSVHVSPPPPSEPCLACIIGVRRGNPDHHRSPLRFRNWWLCWIQSKNLYSTQSRKPLKWDIRGEKGKPWLRAPSTSRHWLHLCHMSSARSTSDGRTLPLYGTCGWFRYHEHKVTKSQRAHIPRQWPPPWATVISLNCFMGPVDDSVTTNTPRLLRRSSPPVLSPCVSTRVFTLSIETGIGPPQL